MANITTTKEKALKRIQDKIGEAHTIRNKLTSEISQAEYRKLLNEAEIWKTSSGNALKQIFSDEHLSKVFLEDDSVILLHDNSFSKNISSLKDELIDDIKKLEHIINDLNENLYTQQGDKEAKLAKWGFLQTVIVALITAGAGIFTGYLAIPHKTDPLEKQGLSTITLEGKWKYICTSFDGSYQHGGRFIVQKEADGSLILNGERMWKDIKDTSGKWHNKVYEESDY